MGLSPSIFENPVLQIFKQSHVASSAKREGKIKEKAGYKKIKIKTFHGRQDGLMDKAADYNIKWAPQQQLKFDPPPDLLAK